MFVEYLSDSAWENRSHRGWTALASFTLQALALSVLLVLPILYSSFVPSLEFIRPVAPLAQPAPVPESAHAARSSPRTSNLTMEGACDLSRRCTRRNSPADGRSVTETTMRTVEVVML